MASLPLHAAEVVGHLEELLADDLLRAALAEPEVTQVSQGEPPLLLAGLT